MVALTYCAGCTTGHHEDHVYWIQQPPKGVMGGFACKCSGADECAGNGEKLLWSLFGDHAPGDAPVPAGPTDAHAQLREEIARAMWNALPATPHGWDLVSDGSARVSTPGPRSAGLTSQRNEKQ